jgi:hypothetical protein
MNISRHVFYLLLLVFSAASTSTGAGEVMLFYGGGPQQHDSDQHNRGWGIDYSFYKIVRSVRSELSFGVGYTRMTNDADAHDSLHAISLYPQLTLYPEKPVTLNPFFFVRALGPTYISENQFGSREQDNHLSFQSQVGIGIRPYKTETQQLRIMLSWKHFSNANLFNDNDGFDLPITLSLGFDI